jgi:branched-chain amino acid transport system substrate-binding protein
MKAASAAGTAGLVGLAGCTGGGTDGGESGDGGDGGDSAGITFGQPAILTGGLSGIQPPVSASTDLAVQKINEAGGPLGEEINVVRRDTAYDPTTAREKLRQLINVDNAAVITGLTSTTAVPTWDFIQELEAPVVTMYAGSRFFDTRGGDNGTPQDLSDDGWFWRTTGADTQHTAGAALHAQSSDATNIGVINTKTSGARTWANAFYDAIGVLDGVTQTKKLEVEGGKTTYRSDLESFFEADIDLFGVAVEEAPDAVTMLDQWKQAGYGGKVMLSNPMKNPDVRENLGSRLQDDWVRVSVPATAGPWADTYIEELDSFVTSSDTYDDDLSKNSWSASAYDSITVSALAIHRAGEATHEAIQKNLGPVARPPGKKVSTFADGKEALDNDEEINFVGAQTKVNFNDKGDVFNDVKIWSLGPEWTEQTQIEGSEIEPVVQDVAEQSSDSS